MGIRKGVLGRESREEAIARVRYTGVSPGEQDRESLFSSGKLRRKGTTGPSRHYYTFRQNGRPIKTKSQWLPVRTPEDMEYFGEGRRI